MRCPGDLGFVERAENARCPEPCSVEVVSRSSAVAASKINLSLGRKVGCCTKSSSNLGSCVSNLFIGTFSGSWFGEAVGFRGNVGRWMGLLDVTRSHRILCALKHCNEQLLWKVNTHSVTSSYEYQTLEPYKTGNGTWRYHCCISCMVVVPFSRPSDVTQPDVLPTCDVSLEWCKAYFFVMRKDLQVSPPGKSVMAKR